MFAIERYHDICAGHRVVGQGGKCEHLHGHNYRIYFNCVPDTLARIKEQSREGLSGPPDLDRVGRVLDFGDIKDRLCSWLEFSWDHKFLVWSQDPMVTTLKDLDPDGVMVVPFNPTAENMAEYLVKVIGPERLKGTGVNLIAVKIEETAKCSAIYMRG